ncbi:MAG TPA: DMT family transporter [candidate division Zixibacteria bacterium]|nr:DMT family transporter [candidate division Zixibacteria bacterium]
MLGEFAALGAAVSWTVSALLYKKALSETKPVSANIVRLTLTSAVLLVFLVAAGLIGVLTRLSMSVVVLAGVSGVIGLGLGDTLYMVSLKMIGVARAVPVTCTYPLFNLVWVALFAGEPITWSVALGAVVIVMGVWLLSLEEKQAASGVQRKVLGKGLAVALATALLWSVSIAMMGLAVKETPNLDDAFAINAIRVFTIAVSFAVAAPLVDRSLGFLKMSKRTVVTLIVGGIVALGLGWFLLNYSFIDTPQSRAVPISSATPLFSTLAGVLLLHEKANAKIALGSIMVVAGIFTIFLI